MIDGMVTEQAENIGYHFRKTYWRSLEVDRREPKYTSRKRSPFGRYSVTHLFLRWQSPR